MEATKAKNVIRGRRVRELTGQVEKGATEAVRAWKREAERHDRVGEVSLRTLELVHRGLDIATRSLDRMTKATVPPTRHEKPSGGVRTPRRAERREPQRRGTATTRH